MQNMTANTAQYIKENKAIAIIRRVYGDDLLNLARALAKGGIRLMEVTFDQADPDCIQKTSRAIESLCDAIGGDMVIGAGTVMSTRQVDAAIAAGARYIISPNTSARVITYTKEKGVVSIPGAMTPSEMALAHDCGADFVKVFPAGDLGVAYMKNVMAPLSHIQFIATGGVGASNFAEYLEAGFVGAGIGGFLSDKNLLKAGDFDEFTRRAKILADVAAGKE